MILSKKMRINPTPEQEKQLWKSAGTALEAGVNLALVSYYFGGKEKVFHAIFEEFFPQRLVSAIIDSTTDPMTGIQLIIRGVIQYRIEDPEIATITNQEITLQTPTPLNLSFMGLAIKVM